MEAKSCKGSLIRLAKVGAGTLLALAAFFTAASFASCDDDDDEESYVESFAESDSYGTALKSSDAAYPVSGAKDAPIDGYMRLTFSSKPSLTKGACIYIYKDGGESGDTLVDTIGFAGESLTGQTTSYSVNVDDQLVYVDGTSVYFMPHYGVLDYDTTYFVAVPTGTISGTLNSTDFSSYGLSSGSKSWSFTTRSAPTVSTSTAITIDAAESSGTNDRPDFRTVHGALDAIGSSSGSYTLSVAAGDYKELVSWKGNASITITGETTSSDTITYGSDVVIHWRNYQGYNGSSSTRPSFYYGGKDLVLENITLQNDFDRSLDTGNTQAETLYFNSSSNLAAYNCSFLSHQDTLLTKGKNWFYKCHIEGDVDFIWGYADAALFEECELVCVYDSNATSHSAYIFETRVGTVSSDTTVGKGYVIFNSTVTVESGTTAYYGRRASSGSSYYDQAALVDVTIDGTLADAHWYVGNEPCGLTGTLYGDYADVGWKEYNVTSGGSTSVGDSSLTYAGKIDDTEYTYEYSGRYTILNRVYNISDKTYKTASSTWDTSTLASNWSATTDASASLYSSSQ